MTYRPGTPHSGESVKVVVREVPSRIDLKREKGLEIGFPDLIISTSVKVADRKRPFGPEGIGSTIWLGKLVFNQGLKHKIQRDFLNPLRSG